MRHAAPPCLLPSLLPLLLLLLRAPLDAAAPTELRFDGEGFRWQALGGALLAAPAARRFTFAGDAPGSERAMLVRREAAGGRGRRVLPRVPLPEEDALWVLDLTRAGLLPGDAFTVGLRAATRYLVAPGNVSYWDAAELFGVYNGTVPAQGG